MVEQEQLTVEEKLQQQILTLLDKHQIIDDTDSLVSDHATAQQVDAALKSLLVDDFVVLDVIERKKIELTEEGRGYAENGTPEYQYANALVLNVVTSKADVELKVGDLVAKIGFAKAMKNKWVRLESDKVSVTRIAETLVDEEKDQLSAFVTKSDLESHDKKLVDALKKRKLLNVVSKKSYKVTKGSEYMPVRAKMETQLTADMLRSGAWKDAKFKKTNLNAAGQVPMGGHLHPLLKVRAQFRQTLLEMGFNEMPTDRFVESGFWNFDSLFQPQSHPARDMHDTFFLKNPVSCNHVPEEYCAKVKKTHEDGLEGSFGYGKGWSLEESKKNILRTHTTAISSQMLYKLAQEAKTTGVFKPMKYFSIDRVFRNETLDATHLAEFHQVEGLIIDKNIGLANLLGVMETFFKKIGMTNLKYKPAFNPYTEPSLEIFAYHPMLKRWVEIGNSGIFRPEMLEPMGFEKDVSVIAWGLSLERPTMIYYGVDNIRDMVGSKVSLQDMKDNPICYIQQQQSA